jgi:putative ABC transport system ATP-binding protein
LSGSVSGVIPPDDSSDVVLEVEKLTKTFPRPGGDVHALDDVSFRVAPGELVAIFGPSGSGKSTLMKLLARVLSPTSGRVLVNGGDIAQLRRRDLDRFRRDALGVVLQDTRLAPGLTVLQNAMVRLLENRLSWRDARAQVLPLLERLELTGRLGHRPGELSGGEIVRVAMARALSTRPALVLADEPTGALDSRTARIVLRMFDGLCREDGVATVVTTHDPAARSVARRSLVLHDGRIVA